MQEFNWIDDDNMENVIPVFMGYEVDRENNISAITMSLSEYKEKDFPLSTIRNTRRDIELFLEKKGINHEIGSLLQKKGLFMKIERVKGNKNF